MGVMSAGKRTTRTIDKYLKFKKIVVFRTL